MTTNLTAAVLRELLFYDPETGVFIRRRRASTSPVGAVAGCHVKTGYVSIGVAGKDYLAHRLAVLYMSGQWPEHEVDHRDGDRANNRWDNLRNATTAENAMNRRTARPHTSSGLLGAKLVATTGRWRADIKDGKKYRYLGTYSTPAEAHAAYIKAKREIHSFCTL